MFWGCLAWLWLSASLESRVFAQVEPQKARVSTRVDPCVPVELDQFHRVLAIELGTSIEYSADVNQKGGLTTIRLSCRDGGIELHLEDELTHKSMTRVVDIARIEPAARSRLLALAVAEFVVASWVELRVAAPEVLNSLPPKVARTADKAVSRFVGARLPPLPAAPLPDSDWRLGATFDAIMFASTAGFPVPGAGVQLMATALRPIDIGATFQLAHRDVRTNWDSNPDFGDIRLTLMSSLLSMRYTAVSGDLELSIGVGARLGAVQFAGRTMQRGYRSRAFFLPWGGAALALAGAYHAGRHLRVILEVEAGYVAQPAYAAFLKQAILRIDKGWFGGSFGLAWAM